VPAAETILLEVSAVYEGDGKQRNAHSNIIGVHVIVFQFGIPAYKGLVHLQGIE